MLKRKGGRGDEREEKGEKRGREEKWRKKKGKRVVTCIMNAFLFSNSLPIHTHTTHTPHTRHTPTPQSVSLVLLVQPGCCKL